MMPRYRIEKRDSAWVVLSGTGLVVIRRPSFREAWDEFNHWTKRWV